MILIYGETKQNSLAAKKVGPTFLKSTSYVTCDHCRSYRCIYRLQSRDSVIPRYEDSGLERLHIVLLAEEEILNIVKANIGGRTTNLAEQVNVC